jgi:polar amino acid transport system substrate-binding protein
MPPITKQLLFILFLSYSSSSHANFKECNTPLKLSSTSEWYPYIYQDENGVSTGVDVELLTIILNKMGCQLEVVHFPERRALLELKRGRFDIALGASKTESRLKEFFYSNAYRNERNKLAYRINEKDIATANNFQDILKTNKIIAINYAGWYGDEISQAKNEYKYFSYIPTANNRLKMLNLNRVDIVIDDDIVLCSELQRSAYQDIQIHPIVLFETPVYFIFNKESVSPRFIEQFNKTLQSMKDNRSLADHFYLQLPARCQSAILH